LLFHFLKDQKIDLPIEEEALEFLTAYEWPGNIRELKNLAERIAVIHQGDTISAGALRELLNIKNKDPGQNEQANPLEGVFERNYNEARDFFEKCYLEYNFFRNGGIISKTAEAIGIYPSNLHSKIKKYGISAKKEEK